MSDNTHELHNQISSILDKNNKEHQILALLAKILDSQLSHQNNNIKQMQLSIYNELNSIREEVKKISNQSDVTHEKQNARIEQLGKHTECPFEMVEVVEGINKRVTYIEEIIDIFKTIKKYKWLSILAVIGICSLLGLGAMDIINAVKQLQIIK